MTRGRNREASSPFFVFSIGLSIGLWLALTVACAGPPPPVDHHYRLTIESPAPFSTPPLAGRLEIQRFRAESIAQGRRIAFRHAGQSNEIGLYAYQHWVDPLPVMVQGALGQALRKSRVASVVSIPEFRLEPDFVLFGRIVAFERVIGAETSSGVVEIEFSLVRESDRSMVLHQSYREEVAATESTIPSTVDALSTALNRVIANLVRDLTDLSDSAEIEAL